MRQGLRTAPANVLPKFCGWNLDRNSGRWRVRFRRAGFSIYLTGEPWSDEFRRQYEAALSLVPNLSKMHRWTGVKWEHWQISRRDRESRWRLLRRTKCVSHV